MYRLAPPCLLFMGCLSPLFSLPVPNSRDEPLLLSAPDGGIRPALDKGDTAALLHQLPQMLGAEMTEGLRKEDPDTNIFNPRGITRKPSSGQEPSNMLLTHLLARLEKQHEERGHPSDCFWKYCV